MARFVVLEHRWDGVHWDFMLERDGTLKTWALEAEPAEATEVAARALPDHRMAYLDYEGPISGGRGEVRRLDTGGYQILEWGEDRVRVVLAGAQLVGEVDLRRDREAGTWAFLLGGNADRST